MHSQTLSRLVDVHTCKPGLDGSAQAPASFGIATTRREGEQVWLMMTGWEQLLNHMDPLCGPETSFSKFIFK